jgi:hypothetical protein
MKMKVDFDIVESVFVDAVVDQAEEKGVNPSKIALVLFPMKKGRGYRTRVKIFSLDNSFQTEVVKLRKITMYDMTGHISQAIMKIFEHEIGEHNMALQRQVQIESTKNCPKPIGYDGFECYIQVKLGEDQNWQLDMTFTHDHEYLRKYNIRTEFAQVEGEEFDVKQ